MDVPVLYLSLCFDLANEDTLFDRNYVIDTQEV